MAKQLGRGDECMDLEDDIGPDGTAATEGHRSRRPPPRIGSRERWALRQPHARMRGVTEVAEEKGDA